MNHLTEYIVKKKINIINIVNAGGLPGLKCYYHVSKLNYNIFYKNEKDKWIQIDKEKLIKVGKKMIKYDIWMPILFIKPGHNIAEFRDVID